MYKSLQDITQPFFLLLVMLCPDHSWAAIPV